MSGSDKSSEVDSQEIIEVKNFATQPALVHFSYPIKKALEFQSAGVELGVTLPCYVEEIEQGIERAKEIVIEHTARMVPEVNKVLDKLVDQYLESKTQLNRGTWEPRK